MSYDVDDNSMTKHGMDPGAFIAYDAKAKKNIQPIPQTPAVVLTNPKYPHNVGQAVRALSCFDVKQLWWSGKRALLSLQGMSRIPREERMRGYADVEILHAERPLEAFQNPNVVPVCIELVPGAEELYNFQHPEQAVYVFGPEDGSVDQGTRRRCHRFVYIPMKHCANLAAAVYMVLYDRAMKGGWRGNLVRG